MNEIGMFIKDAISFSTISLAFLVVFIGKDLKLLNIILATSFFSVIESIFELFYISPIFFALFKKSFEIDPLNAVSALLMMFLFRAAVASCFAIIFYIIIKRKRKHKEVKQNIDAKNRRNIFPFISRRIGSFIIMLGLGLIALGFITSIPHYDGGLHFGEILVLLGAILVVSGVLFYCKYIIICF